MSVTPRVQQMNANGLELSVTTAGDESAPAVVLLHGFPELAYSWRHQIAALAEAGYRVLAPDQRGYGHSECPEGIDAYGIGDLVGDVIGLLDAQDIAQAVVVGHDWGSIVAPWVALMRPDRVSAVAMLSVPYIQRGDRSVIDLLRATDPEGEFAYMLAFQEPGVEDLFDTDPIATLRSVYLSNSGEAADTGADTDTGATDTGAEGEEGSGLPSYLSAGDFEAYARAFAANGFANPINWYRNLHANWERTRPWHQAQLQQPALFIAGDRDFVATTADGGLGSGVADLERTCADLRGVHMIEGAGHWVQQEAPDQVSSLLIEFLGEVTE